MSSGYVKCDGDDALIQVEMDVTRFKVHRGDAAGETELWGYVGDYEVMLVLPTHDPRVQKLLEKFKE